MLRSDFTSLAPGRVVDIGDGLVAYVPNPLDNGFEVKGRLVTAHEDALLALGELRAMIPSLPRPEIVTQPFLAREAVLSSRIEGTQTQVSDLYLFDASEDENTNEAVIDPTETVEKQDYREVRNYLIALHYGFEQLKRRPLTNTLLKEMHRLLLQHVRGKDKSPGEFRDNIAYIGSGAIERARYVATPPLHIAQCMEDLESYVQASTDGGVPRLVALALVHYQFEAIHPFADGNGRLGRLLVSLMLSQLKILDEPLLYLSAYLEGERQNYNELLWQVSRDGCWDEWVAFFLEGVRSQALDAVERSRGLLQYREDCRKLIQESGKGSGNDLSLLDQLFIRPAVTVNRVMKELDISYPAANSLVERLVKRDILSEATGNARNRIFVAHDILSRIQ